MRKITNVSSDNIRILIRDGISFDLSPNSFIFSDELNMSATIRVYEKKRLITVEDMAKPYHLETLRIYNKIDESNIVDTIQIEATKIFSDEGVEEDFADVDTEKLTEEDLSELVLELNGDFDYDEEVMEELQMFGRKIIDQEIIKVLNREPNDLVPLVAVEIPDAIPPIEEIIVVDDISGPVGSTVEKVATVKTPIDEGDIIVKPPVNKGGRPKGSKNKPKTSRRGRYKKTGHKKGSKNKKK